MVKIGVLGLQGAIREHVRSIEASGAEGIIIKRKEQLEDVQGLILPGGESTTMRRLIDKYDFFDALVEFGKKGKPIFGTCAGLILMAENITGQDNAHLKFMNMTVTRNAFGRQKESFEMELPIKGVAEDFNAVFIRAPYVTEAGDNVEVLAEHNGAIVAAKQDHFLCASFHPELTDDHRITAYFVKMVEKSVKQTVS